MEPAEVRLVTTGMIREQIGRAVAPASKPAPSFKRLPRHVGLIPDGNRRWAKLRGMHPGDGYMPGVEQGLRMLDECIDLGIEEVSVYGFTTDNTKRPSDQKTKFSAACVAFAREAIHRDIALWVVGDYDSQVFPKELLPYARKRVGHGRLKVNMLVNYGWNWDLQRAMELACKPENAGRPVTDLLASADVSRIDLVVRWGGCRRLSGFLPVQSVYADFFVVDEYWPDYRPEQFYNALRWYERQDATLGG